MKSLVTAKNGHVTNTQGNVSIQSDTGSKVANVGDYVPAGTKVSIPDESTLEIAYQDGSTYNSAEVLPEQIETATDTNALNEIEQLQALIAAGDDPTAALPDTAAGGAQGNEGGSDFVSLSRSGAQTIASAGFNTDGISQPEFTPTTELVSSDDSPTIATNDSNTVAEDTVATGNVLDNDSDIDSDLSVVSFTVNGETVAAGTTVEVEGGSLVINADGTYTFTPNDNWNGTVPVITYTTNTGESATLTINVIPVDDPSVLANDSNTIAEDSIATGNVLDNDSDIDSELSVVSFTVNGETVAAGTTVEVEGGSLVINADGTYTFTPNDNWNGSVPVITYTTNTGASATLTIEVTPVDDASVLANDSNTIAEDTVATGNVLDNDSDIDSDLSVVSFTVNGETVAAGTTVEVEGGSLVINTDGSYTFTPNDNWNGSVPVITYTTNTGASATLTIEVTPVDDASVLANDSNTVAEDTVATGNVLDNDSNIDSDLSVVSFTVNGETVAAGTTVEVEGGSLVINADGTYTFTPNDNWNGSVPVITYTTNTGETATLTINVTPVDDPSVLANDSNTVAEDTVAAGNVLDNDSDIDSELSVVSFSVDGQTVNAGTTVEVEGGSLVINTDGSYTFTPNDNWNGSVPVITYTTNTGASATLTIEVTPVDDPSVLANDSNTVAEDSIATGNVLDNDSDIDSKLSVVSFSVDGETVNAGTTVELEGGSLVINADGTYTFTPNDNWNGSVPVITYTTNTGETATLTINVTPVDDPSVLANDSNTVAEDTVAAGNVLDNDSDIDSELSVVSFSVDGQTVNAGTTVELEGGSLVINADGTYTFTPNDNWNGSVPVITYTTNTGESATLTINVTPVDDPSVLANDSNTVAEDTVASGNVLDNDSDIDSDLSVVSFTVNGETVAAGTTVEVEGGSLVINADGTYTFTPNDNWNGSVPVITYTTNTGASATLTIEVTPVDDASVLANDSNTIAEDTVATGNVLDNDSDIDSDLSVVSFTVNGETIAAGTTVEVEGGSLVINADGTYTFTPNDNWNGSVPVITYTTNTGASATLTIEVTPVVDGPPTVTINTDENNDAFISNNELNGSSTIDVTISLENTGANVGDTLIVNGISIVLTQEHITNNSVDLLLPSPGEGNEIVVTATITDQAGNISAPGTDSAILDTSANASIDLSPIDIGGDNVINQAESSGSVTLSGTVGGDVKVGDTVTLTLDGNQIATATVVDLGNGVLGFSTTVDASLLVGANANSITASVTATDSAGNSITVTDTEGYGVDTSANASIDLSPIDIGGDNVINQAESSGSVTLSGTVGGDVKVGDTVTLTLDGNQIATATVVDLGNGVLGFSTTVDASLLVGANANSITASVTATDSAGNSITVTDTEGYGVDTSANASIDLSPIDIGGDNVINQAESSGSVTLSGTVGGDVKVGDTVTLTLDGNQIATATVVDLGNGVLGFSTTVDASLLVGANANSITASVTATDSAGNSITVTDTEGYGVDTSANASIDLSPIDIGGDNVINQAESSGSVTLSGTVGGDVKVGDTVTLTLDGNQIATATVVDLGNGVLGFSTTVDASLLVGANANSITASVTATDSAGNSITVTDTEGYGVDTSANASIDLSPIDIGGDNVINQAESSGSVTLSGTVGGDVKVGDTVTLTLDGNQIATATVVDLGNGVLGFSTTVDASLLVGANANSITASVTATDSAGNSITVTDTEGYGVDTSANASIDLSPIDIGGDNVINQAESSGSVTLSGTVGGDVKVGDTVTLTLDGNQIATATVVDLGNGVLGFSTTVDASLLVGANANSITASVTATDSAGNSITVTDTEGYGVDTSANASIDLSPIDIGGDNVINQAESSGSVTLSGTVGGDVKVGDTVTLTLDGNQIATATVVDLGNGVLGFSTTVDASLLVGANANSITASVTATDSAGNSITVTDTEGYGVDTSANASIDLSPIDIGGDNVINQAESSGSVTLSGTVGGDVKVGDTVTLTLDGNQIATATVVDLGNGVLGFSTTVDASLLVGANANSITASVTATDSAGNSITVTDTEGYGVDTNASATITVDNITSDDVLNAQEAAGDVTVTGTVGGDAAIGDTVTMVINGTTYTTTVIALTTGGLGFSLPVAGSDLALDTTFTATVSGTDDAGNPFTADTISTHTVIQVSGGSNVDLTVDDANTLGTATDSDIAGLSFTAGAHDVTAFAFTNLNEITVDGLDGNLTWSLDSSGNLIGSIGNTAVLQLSLTGNSISAGTTGSVTVSVTLLDNLSHNVSVDELTIDGITVIATDASGATATGTVSVKVVDDGVDLTPQDLVGNNAVGQYEGVINVDGADQNYSADLSSNISGGGTFSNSGITAGGLTVFYYVDPSNPSILIAYSDTSATPSAYDPDNSGQSIIFTLSIDPNSDSYQLDVVRPIDQVETIIVADMSGGKGGNTPAAYVTFDGTNYIINNDISDVDPTHEMIFTLTSTSGLVSSTVNGNTNGFGVQNAWVDQGEALIVDYADNVASASIQFEGATYAHFKAYDANGNLLGEGDITSGQVISNLGEISYIEVSTSAQGNHANFQFTGTSAQNIVTETTDVDLDFNVTVTDSDGDSANGSIHVDLNAPGTNTPTSPTALTTGAISLLSEGDLYSNGSDADSQQLRFKSGSESITSFQFGNTDNIQISGVNANIKWSFNDNGQLIGTFMGKEAISLTLNGGRIESGEEGSVSVTVELLDTFPHNVSAENLVISGIDVIAVDAQGNSATSSMTVQVADDAPEIADAATVAVSDTGIPDALVGSFSLTNSRGSSSDLDFDGFTITARGFTSATDSSLTAASVFGNGSGIGVKSADAPYHQIDGEIDFRKFADGTEASEEIVVTLDPGTLAYGVNIEFSAMFGGELEVGIVEFYRDGQLITAQSFSSDANNGNYAAIFEVLQGGFDQMVIKATDNGFNAAHGDNSDLAIKSIEFLGTDDIAIGYATGTTNVDWGADGRGSLVFAGSEEQGLYTADGQSITTSLLGNTLLGQTDSGELIFKVEFTPSTGQWEFYQYKAIENTADGQLDFNLLATDSDGDSAEGHFAVTPQVVVRDYIQTNGTDGDNTINGGIDNDIIVSDTTGIQVVQGENYNIAFILDSSGSMGSAKIDTVKEQLLQVFNTLKASVGGATSGTVNILLVDFDSGTKANIAVDLADADAITKLSNLLDSIDDDGRTNYEAAFETVIDWFNNGSAASNTGTNLTYFITDGETNNYNVDASPEDVWVYYTDNWKSSDDKHLSDLLDNYVPGKELIHKGKVIVDEYGNINYWSGYNNDSMQSRQIGTIRVDENGDYYVAKIASGYSNGNGTDVNAESEALAAFQVLNTLSNVEAIGIGSGISLNKLTPYDSDGNVATNINVSDLASIILGSKQLLLQGDDTVNSGEGDDIIFGDIVAFDGIEGQGYAALQKFVAQQTGANPADVSIQNVHEYVSANPSLFDTSRSDDGDDILAGNRGDDILFGQGGNDELHGGSGDDLLIGGSGLDELIGGSGSDTLIGGLGDDTLTGGTDADTFVWQQGESGTDHITDFDINQDKLDLSDLLTNENGGNLSQYLHFTVDNSTSTPSTTIDIDADLDGVYEQHIVLDGVDLSKEFGNSEGEIINGLLGTNGDGALIIDNPEVNAAKAGLSAPNHQDDDQILHLLP